VDRSEHGHELTVQTFDRLEKEKRPCFTSSLVVAETQALLLSRRLSSIARAWLGSIPATLVLEDASDHAAALQLLTRHADKDFSYADAVSFVMMERLGIPTAFTFDEHIRQYGVAVLP
jgi:predicted nucleic acid-binding protein